MPFYYIEIVKDDKTEEVKQQVIKHCNIEYFYRCCADLGWVLSNCVEVDGKEEFLSNYVEINSARRIASEEKADSINNSFP